MSGPCPGVTTPEGFARLIVQVEAAGAGHMTGLLRPAARGDINVGFVPRGGTPPLRRLERAGRPVVVVLGDDDYQSTGPDGWACAVKLRRWASYAIVNGGAGDRDHYAMAAVMARRVRRLLFVETSSAAAQEWAGFLKARTPALPFLGILPTVGPHPILPPREAMQ